MGTSVVSIEPAHYRRVSGQYPTGVCLIAAMQESGTPIGMIVGSFTTVSLSPPLVSFFPDRASSSWALLKDCTYFTVNILSADQEDLCRRFASKGTDKFRDVKFRLSPSGSPILEDVVAWIDCQVQSIAEAGDHHIVLGLVQSMEVERGGLPLLFFQGGYGRFTPSSLVAVDTRGLLTEQLRIIDAARPEMERIAADLGVQCVAFTRTDGQLIFAASAGQPAGDVPSAPVGQRVPFAPPLGGVFAAWMSPDEALAWIGPGKDPALKDAYAAALLTVRSRGYAVTLPAVQANRTFSERLERHAGVAEIGRAEFEELVRDIPFDPHEMAADPEVGASMISVPIFDNSGQVVLSLAVIGDQRGNLGQGARHGVSRLRDGARRVTRLLGGREPESMQLSESAAQ